jgi:predicted Rdx family selenoprotein
LGDEAGVDIIISTTGRFWISTKGENLYERNQDDDFG